MAISLEKAKKLDYHVEIWSTLYRDSKGMPIKYRVTGKPKTWKTMPERVEVPIKHGMYGPSDRLTETNRFDFCFSQWEATGIKPRFRKTEPGRYLVIFGKRELGEVWRDLDKHGRTMWYNDLWSFSFRSRKAATDSLCNTLMD